LLIFSWLVGRFASAPPPRRKFNKKHAQGRRTRRSRTEARLAAFPIVCGNPLPGAERRYFHP
jgi:hypothetical protein